jgi:chromosome segregation ATPase
MDGLRTSHAELRTALDEAVHMRNAALAECNLLQAETLRLQEAAHYAHQERQAALEQAAAVAAAAAALRTDLAALEAALDGVTDRCKAAALDISALKAEASSLQPVFDEEWYLKNNPDVRAAVERGELRSGRQHYRMQGQNEGRSPLPPKTWSSPAG